MHISCSDPRPKKMKIKKFENSRLWTAAILKIEKGDISYVQF